MKQQIGADALDLSPAAGREKDLFAWLIPSFLFGKRIQRYVALAAYKVIVEKNGVDSVQKMASCSHRQLVSIWPVKQLS